jgi:hypothetical protein
MKTIDKQGLEHYPEVLRRSGGWCSCFDVESLRVKPIRSRHLAVLAKPVRILDTVCKLAIGDDQSVRRSLESAVPDPDAFSLIDATSNAILPFCSTDCADAPQQIKAARTVPLIARIIF